MAWLYCVAHGREKELWLIDEEDELCQDGESVLVVKGTLKSGPWRCDRCNAPLKQGDAASFLAVFSKTTTECIDEYDFDYEREYFAMKGDETVTLYGAAWPAWLMEGSGITRSARGDRSCG